MITMKECCTELNCAAGKCRVYQDRIKHIQRMDRGMLSKYPSKYQKDGEGYVEGTPIYEFQLIMESFGYLPKGTANGVFGPYLLEWPENPFSPSSVARDITFGTQASPPRDNTTGWHYNTNTGVVSANSEHGGESLDP